MKKQIKDKIFKLIGQAVVYALMSYAVGYFIYWSFLQNTIY